MNTDNKHHTTKKQKFDWWLYSVPILIVLTIAFYLIIQSRPGGLTGVMLYYLGPFSIAVLAIIFIIIGIILSFKRRPFFNRFRVVGFILLISLCFTGNLFSRYPSSYDDKPSQVKFKLPLDSLVTVGWGGGNEKVNYHVIAPDQCWAYDLLIMKGGKTFSGDSTKLVNYYCYGKPVLSPAAGKIIKAYHSDPDMPIGVLGGGKEPVGNHVIIEVAPKQFLFICHLKPNSIKVKEGDMVEAGQELALVGNSGNTSEPHIHIHLQSTTQQSFGEGIPLYFHDYMLNGKHISKGIPTGGFDDVGKFIGQTIQNVKR